MKHVDNTISGAFAAQVAAHPDRPAVVEATGQLSYRDLDLAAKGVAAALPPGLGNEPVAIIMGHEVKQIVAMIAVMRAGAIAMPLDGALPAPERDRILEKAGAKLVLTDAKREMGRHDPLSDGIEEIGVGVVPAEDPEWIEKPPLSPDLPCALFQSAGSRDGRSRGSVPCSHRSLLANARNFVACADLTEDDRVCPLTHCHHPAAIPVIFGALLSGACLLPFNVRSRSLANLGRWLGDEEVSIYYSDTTVFRRLCESLPQGLEFPKMRLVAIGGEPAYNSDIKLFQRHFPVGSRLMNAFGSGEANGILCCRFFDHSTSPNFEGVPVGRPLPGMEILLVDENGHPVPPREKGEVAFRHSCGAPDDWRGRELREREIAPPPGDDGAPFRKTGDTGWMSSSDELVLAGRKGSHLKINGRSVDPHEIELSLLEHPSIVQCAVSAWGAGSKPRQLVAWVVSGGNSVPSPSELRVFLAEKLPPSTIPSAFCELEELPVDGSGKLVRGDLPDPFAGRNGDLPSNAIELILVKMWRKVLRRKSVGTSENFFEAGGDSLLAAVLLSRIQNELKIELPLEVLMESPTIRGLTEAIRETSPDSEFSPLLPVKKTGSATPIFWAPGAGIYAGVNHPLGDLLENDHPFYTLRYKGIDGFEEPQKSVQDIAAYFIEEIRRLQEEGPYILGGGSFGGIVAYEAAQQLIRDGERVELLVIEDTRIERKLSPKPGLPIVERLKRRLRVFMPLGQRDDFLWKGLKGGLRQWRDRRAVPRERKRCRAKQELLPKYVRFHEVLDTSLAAFESYGPEAYTGGRVVLFRYRDAGALPTWYDLDPSLGWGRLCPDLEIVELWGKHGERARNDAVLKEFAEKLDAVLGESQPSENQAQLS